MSTPPGELQTELDAFRKQWLTEVKSKRPGPGHGPTSGPSHTKTPSTSDAVPVSRPDTQSRRKDHFPERAAAPLADADADADDDQTQPPAFDEILSMAASKGKETAATADDGGSGDGAGNGGGDGELKTALDHFEAAVVREAQGNLGDSLGLYRKAFRMDSEVDQAYRKKYFPPTAPEPPGTHRPAPTAAAAGPPVPAQSVHDLISAFQDLSVVPLAPEIEGTPAPPCPIAVVPDELLAHIFHYVAVNDVADFSRLSLVCKRFAYLVSTEQRIWRRVCLGSEFGFAGMHYRFQRTVSWDPLSSGGGDHDEEEEEENKAATTITLLPALYSSSWRQMFRHRPRIRFNGCYISTVNYFRPGGHGHTSHITWHSPVHIVTYYRYLRFFRDGTAASLLTTAEPADVVPHLTRASLELHHRGAPGNSLNHHLPSAVLRDALRGRWRLAAPDAEPEGRRGLGQAGGGAARGAPGSDLVIETEGVAPKYMYRMDLSLRSAGKTTRNNKLVWRGFYSYNKLADDWAEFLLKNDRPFFFSRVRSYGVGE